MLYKKLLACLLVVCFAATSTAQDEQPAAKKVMQGSQAQVPAQGRPAQGRPATPPQEVEMTEEEIGSTIDKASFLIGYNMIKRLKAQDADFKFEKILEGLNAAKDDREADMTREEQRAVLLSYQQINRQKMIRKREAQAETNGEEGAKAFAEFAKQEGAKELEPGIMYIVETEGEGKLPEAPDSVRLHYKGTYADGTEFDSSYTKGEPIVNNVLGFVPGFSKALQAMKVGSKWKVLIDGEKAYGMRPRPPMEVNKTLMFDIELIEIMPVK